MPVRKGRVERKTGETKIMAGITLEGTGKAAVETGIPFLDHMLASFARHGRFDLEVKGAGDLGVDPHHLMEDTGIVLPDYMKLADAFGYEKYCIKSWSEFDTQFLVIKFIL
jgi:imidazoleglycerol-phosphate dehydratase